MVFWGKEMKPANLNAGIECAPVNLAACLCVSIASDKSTLRTDSAVAILFSRGSAWYYVPFVEKTDRKTNFASEHSLLYFALFLIFFFGVFFF